MAEICRRAGIRQATYFDWKKKYEGLLPAEMRRLKQLEDENAKLRKLVADLALDREMKIRVPTVVDTFSRFSPAVDPRFSYRAEDVVAKLERVCAKLGCPKTIRVDQGSEFVSRDLDLWAYANGVTLDVSRPGKPTDNAFMEAFNGRFREPSA